MPTVVTWPTALPASQQLDDIILNIDFPALLLDVAGAQPLPGMQGRSFLSNLQGQTPPDWRQEMYYRYWSNQPERPAHLGIRSDRYKLAFFYGQPRDRAELVEMPHPPGWEFYDLAIDPLEQHNAITDPEYADEISRMRARLNQLKQELGDDDTGQPVIKSILRENGIF